MAPYRISGHAPRLPATACVAAEATLISQVLLGHAVDDAARGATYRTELERVG